MIALENGVFKFSPGNEPLEWIDDLSTVVQFDQPKNLVICHGKENNTLVVPKSLQLKKKFSPRVRTFLWQLVENMLPVKQHVLRVLVPSMSFDFVRKSNLTIPVFEL
jgi:hypothetical protein